MEEDSTDKIFAVNPPPPDFNPVKQAVARAEELGEKQIATALGYFSTMPASTGIIANPVLYHTPVDCNGTQITLDIRSFTIRGIIPEADILRGVAGPIDVIFTGLFAEAPNAAAVKETLAKFVNDKFFESVRSDGRLVDMVAAFVKKYPGLGPEVAMQHMATLRKAKVGRPDVSGIHDERESGELLSDMIACHMENVAVGGVSAYMNYLLFKKAQSSEGDLAAATNDFIGSEVSAGRTAFQVSYSLILGRHANDHE